MDDSRVTDLITSQTISASGTVNGTGLNLLADYVGTHQTVTGEDGISVRTIITSIDSGTTGTVVLKYQESDDNTNWVDFRVLETIDLSLVKGLKIVAEATLFPHRKYIREVVTTASRLAAHTFKIVGRITDTVAQDNDVIRYA
jgi:hypothetical protein